jgi:hypothetical protein
MDIVSLGVSSIRKLSSSEPPFGEHYCLPYVAEDARRPSCPEGRDVYRTLQLTEFRNKASLLDHADLSRTTPDFFVCRKILLADLLH